MFILLEGIAALAALAWFFGAFHGPDARHLMAFLLVLSGGIQFFLKKRVPESFLWKFLIHFFRWLEGSTSARHWVLALVFSWSVLLQLPKALAGRYMMFDQGIFTQILWSLVNGLGFRSTIEAPGDHFLVHFSPALALIAPVLGLFHFHPIGLIIVSNLCVWGSVLAWMKMVRVHPAIDPRDRSSIEAGVLILGVFFDSFWANFFWGFHEAHLAVLLISWGLYFHLAGKGVVSLLLWVLAALCKEVYLLDVAVLLFAVVSLRPKRAWLFGFTGVGCLMVFVLYRKWSMQMIQTLPANVPRDYLSDLFSHHFGYLGGGSFLGLAKETVADPLGVVFRWWQQTGKHGMIYFPLELIFALGGGVFFAGAGFRRMALGALPSFLTIFLAASPQMGDFGLQYILMLWPFVYFVSLPGFKAHFLGIRHAPLLLAIFIAFWGGGLDYLKLARKGVVDFWERRPFLEKLEQIGPNESVLSDEMGLYLAARETVQSPPNLHFFKDHCPDWIISAASKIESTKTLIAGKCKSGYKLRFDASGMVGYKKL